MKITIVGLGTSPDDITLAGQNAIENSDYILLKTNKSTTFQYFSSRGIQTSSCDGLYNNAKDFDELNNLIVNRVLQRAKTHKNLVFCVNGCSNDDTSVQLLKNSPDVELTIIPGIANHVNILKFFPLPYYTTISAINLINFENISNNFSLLITEVYNASLASDVKLRLMELYDPDYNVYLCTGENLINCPLHEIDMQTEYDYSTTLYIPTIPLVQKKRFCYEDLVDIMKILRGENGCSWDKAQTHSSIRHNTIEEAYELSQAIDNYDIENMIEEIGDMLMQAVFHIEIARDEDEFDYGDVYTRVCKKLISRHTHIFGSDTASTPDEVLKLWEANKLKEKNMKTVTDNLKDVPMSMTALMRASKVQHRAAKVGFDWPDADGAITKVLEEIGEVSEALKDIENKDALEGEIGDLFFALVNVSRLLDIDAEVALSRTTNKFIKRFSYIEQSLYDMGKDIHNSSLAEMDALWNKAKEMEGKQNEK